MSYLHDELDDEQPHQSSHRELTLSTGTILGIFFGLALLCALFFGFGYNMGSKSHQATVVTADAPAPDPNAFNSFKPPSGAPATAPSPGYTLPKPVDTNTTATTGTQPAPIIRTPAPATLTTTPATPTPAPVAHAVPANEAGITFIVQVAAVSHQEDADLLVAALKRKGYSVNARTTTQDPLVHIQIGPFPTKKDAEAMRQRLLGDGYNAIVK